MNIKHLICVSAIFALLICAGPANADTLFSYDFENPPVTTGSIIGQDSWEVTGLNPTNWVPAHVGNGTNGNTSQVFMGNPAGTTSTAKTSGAKRYHTTPLVFDAADTAIELNFNAYSERGSETYDFGELMVGMMWNGVNEYYGLGMYFKNSLDSTPNAWYRDGKGGIFYGDDLVAGHWYDIKAVMDFSQVCSDSITYGKLSYYYRDVTAGDTEFTLDGSLHDKDMYVPMVGGEAQSNGLFCYTKCYNDTYQQKQYIDNITVVDPVPEPSTIALLITGLIGLLAYAWRKRK